MWGLSWPAIAAALMMMVAGAGAGVAAPVRADTAVDLQLVLAVDASGSVSTERFELQKRGYAEAFRHPRVASVIGAGAVGAIAVTMVHWTGPAMQVQVTPWTRISGAASASAFADAIADGPRQLFGGGTSISGAIDYAMALFAQSPYRAERRIIDISGDGPNNRGRPAAAARDEAVAKGVTINGLPILVYDSLLDRYFESEVIGGPGAFMIAAQRYEDFAAAVLRKLILEIAGGEPRYAGDRRAGDAGGARGRSPQSSHDADQAGR